MKSERKVEETMEAQEELLASRVKELRRALEERRVRVGEKVRERG